MTEIICSKCEYFTRCADDPQRTDYCPKTRVPNITGGLMKLEEKIKRILKKHADDFGDIAVNDGEQVSEIIPELLSIIREAGYVPLAPEEYQKAPDNPYPEDVFPDGIGYAWGKAYELAQKDMLTPRKVIINGEEKWIKFAAIIEEVKK